MKISYKWLKEYVDIKLEAEKLAQELTMAGLEVTSIEKIGNDSIMEFEITPNRPDWLSYIGIARETAAITGKKLKVNKPKLTAYSLKLKAAIEIKDKDLCPKYTARIIEGVNVGPSPKWLVEKLEKMNLRPVNNVVDITNFCLFESGQPLHAFDYDRLEDKKIIVRRAKKDEKITTIDGDQRALSGNMLVIADGKRAVAVGGVMGSANSEVTSSTKTILLESAYFNPISVRRTSRKLGLVSESSYRFERSVDIDGVIPTSDRAVSLILELCGGKAGPITDAGAKKSTKKLVTVRPSKIKSVLGGDISNAFIKKTLINLGLKVKAGSKDKLSVAIPGFRQDLKKEIDLIEEIARIYGYDKFSSTIPAMVDQTQKKNFDFDGCEERRLIKDTIKNTLVSLGLNEIITYSLISEKYLESLDGINKQDIIHIKNPLSSEQEVMRPTLVPGSLNIISRNINRRLKDQKLFELGKVYLESGGEIECLAISLTGLASGFWLNRKKVDLFYLKGIIESLFERLGIRNYSINIEKAFSREGKSVISIDSQGVGIMAGASKKTLGSFDIKQGVFIAQMAVRPLIKAAKLHKRFREITKFPSAARDLSIIVDETVLREKIASTIKKSGGALVKKVDFFDQYKGKQIPEGKKGLSYSIEYQAKDRTLTDNEVNKLHSEITSALKDQLGAQIR